ncbi:hypothetical protein PVL29_001050 [Vitis rotundifolia]|uniref:Uncharacterized protein n=1 Tax=Vitis rotundifolia TaxID=103349 RepID=A0AA39E8N2_VITRO|nr:hypothetical protein PVL29_001050 [Vitis rotundifolia]
MDWGCGWKRRCYKNRGISISDMIRVVRDDDPGGEVGNSLCRINLWSWILMACLIKPEFNYRFRRAKSHHHIGLQGTSFYTSHWDSSNPINLMHIL